jgi:hypothetical protein
MDEEEIRLVYLLYKETKALTREYDPANQVLERKFVPFPYPTKRHFDTAITRLQRTGFVHRSENIRANGTCACQTSPLFEELLALVNLQTFDFVH